MTEETVPKTDNEKKKRSAFISVTAAAIFPIMWTWKRFGSAWPETTIQGIIWKWRVEESAAWP
jgi:hypothetical protein